MAASAQSRREAATVENSTSTPPVTAFGAMRVETEGTTDASLREHPGVQPALVGKAKCTSLHPEAVQCA
jgi:hypothetical protein